MANFFFISHTLSFQRNFFLPEFPFKDVGVHAPIT